jgi:hypothetical protein
MNNVPPRRATVALAFLFLLLFFSAPLQAQGQGPGQSADIVISVIEASNGGGNGVDPQIRGLVKEFGGALRYSTYRLVSRIPRELREGERETVSLPGDRQMQLQMQGHEGNRIKLRVRLTEKSSEGGSREKLNTEFRLIEGGTIMIGGYHYRDGKLLIAISAK